MNTTLIKRGVAYAGGRYAEATPAELVALQEAIYQSPNPTRRWLHALRLSWVRNNLKAYGGLKKSVLEIGPGCGIYIPTMQQYYGKVVVSDIEDAYLDASRRYLKTTQSNLKVVRDDVTASTQKPASFDVILCSEVLEHLPNRALLMPALKGIHGLLKPGGVLLLSTPQSYSSLELLGRIVFHPVLIGMVRWFYKGEPILPPGHTNLMTAQALRRALTQAGFTIESHTRFALYIPFVAEMGGQSGQRFAARMANLLQHVPLLSGLLWTQAWVARKAQSY